MNDILISSNEIVLGIISYQPVISIRRDLKYLRSVNILINGKIIEKIYMKEPLISYSLETAQKIAENFLINKLISKEVSANMKKEYKPNSTSAKVDVSARAKVSTNLFSDLGM